MRSRSNSADGYARHLGRQSNTDHTPQALAGGPSPGLQRFESISSSGVTRKRSSGQYGGIPGVADVRRWDGPNREASDWDGLRRVRRDLNALIGDMRAHR